MNSDDDNNLLEFNDNYQRATNIDFPNYRKYSYNKKVSLLQKLRPLFSKTKRSKRPKLSTFLFGKALIFKMEKFPAKILLSEIEDTLD